MISAVIIAALFGAAYTWAAIGWRRYLRARRRVLQLERAVIVLRGPTASGGFVELARIAFAQLELCERYSASWLDEGELVGPTIRLEVPSL